MRLTRVQQCGGGIRRSPADPADIVISQRRRAMVPPDPRPSARDQSGRRKALQTSGHGEGSSEGF